MQQSYKFKAPTPCRRIDILMVDYFEDLGDAFSRNSIQELIRTGAIKVDGKTVKPSNPSWGLKI